MSEVEGTAARGVRKRVRRTKTGVAIGLVTAADGGAADAGGEHEAGIVAEVAIDASASGPEEPRIEQCEAEGVVGAARRRASPAKGKAKGKSKAKPAARAGRTATGKRRPMRGKTRWSAKREALFLAALAETSHVAGSIRAAGLAETTVYRRRQRSAEFRAKWAAALREGYLKLEGEMLSRALNGVEKAVWHGGQQVGTVTEYNDRTALALLNAHRATVMGTGPAPANTSIEDLRAGLKRRLAEMNERMGGGG